MLRVSLFVLLAIAACKSRTEKGGRPQVRPIDPPAAPGALAPNLRESREGVLATWLEPAGGGGHRLRFSRWANRAWSAPVTIAESMRIVANWADVPSAARGGDGALVAHWAEIAGGNEAHTYDAIVARSTDGGATWKRLGALNDDGTATEHGFVSLLGEAGGVRAFWLDGRATAAAGGAMTLRTATVAEGVAPSALVDDRVCDCCGTAATATADGPLVAYRDRGGDETRDIAVARGGTAGWSQPSAVHRDGWQIHGCPVNGPALAARDGRVAIAWYTYAESTHRVRAAFSDDSGASFDGPIEVDGPRGSRAPLGRVSVALADDGSAVVGFLASDREDAEVLLRRVGRDGTLGPELRVGAQLAGRDAGFPRLARSGDSLVVIWTEPGPTSRLRAAEVPLAALPLAAPPLAALPLPGPRLAERRSRPRRTSRSGRRRLRSRRRTSKAPRRPSPRFGAASSSSTCGRSGASHVARSCPCSRSSTSTTRRVGSPSSPSTSIASARAERSPTTSSGGSCRLRSGSIPTTERHWRSALRPSLSMSSSTAKAAWRGAAPGRSAPKIPSFAPRSTPRSADRRRPVPAAPLE